MNWNIVAPILIILVFGGIIFYFAYWRKRGKTNNPSTQVPDELMKKIPYRLTDWKPTPKGSSVSAVVKIPQVALTVLDDAEAASLFHFRHHFPTWTVDMQDGTMDVLFVEPDGTLETIPGYPRPYLQLGGVNTAGTVLWGERTFLLLPHHEKIDWANLHYLFWTYFNEGEHAREFVNSQSEWLKYVGYSDSHPHKPIPPNTPLPDYATQEAVGFLAAGQRAILDAPRCITPPKSFRLSAEQEARLVMLIDNIKSAKLTNQ